MGREEGKQKEREREREKEGTELPMISKRGF
jgi:hypothetical protein